MVTHLSLTDRKVRSWVLVGKVNGLEAGTPAALRAGGIMSVPSLARFKVGYSAILSSTAK